MPQIGSSSPKPIDARTRWSRETCGRAIDDFTSETSLAPSRGFAGHWSTAVAGMREFAPRRLKEDTSRCCDGRVGKMKVRLAHGTRRSALPQQKEGTSRCSNGRGSNTLLARGTIRSALPPPKEDTLRCCSGRGSTVAVGTT